MDTNTAMALDYKKYLEVGIEYDTYKENLAKDAIDYPDEHLKHYIVMNQHRMHRVEKTAAISPKLAQAINGIKDNIYWLVLTEHWCGDASQIVPFLHKIATESNGKITLKLVYRDQNLDLMDAYLTNNGRSIPKVIQLDSHYHVTGVWGPRPVVAQELVMRLKADEATKETYAEQLHLWYAKDKQHLIGEELTQLIAGHN